MLKVRKYIGDEKFHALLTRAGCDKSIDFIKSAILGAQSSYEDFTVDNILLEIFPRDKLKSVDKAVIGEIENLWSHLYAMKSFSDDEHIKPVFEVLNRDNFLGFVQRQVEAGEEFLKYINHGNIDHYLDDEKIEKIYKIYSVNLELLKTLLNSMKKNWSDRDFEDADSLLKRLKSYTKVLWDTRVSLKELIKQKKNDLLKNKSIISSIENQMGKKVKRNDPCPCGSEKKYKNCCGKG